MPDRRDRAKSWIRGIIPHAKASKAAAPAPAASMDSHLPNEPPVDTASPSPGRNPEGIPSTTTTDSTIDELTLVLSLVQQVANMVQKIPFVAPAAAIMSEILKAYTEVRDTNEKRDMLFIEITHITRDLCATILRMEATNHIDLIGRLKTDIELFAGLLEKASAVIKEYDNQGKFVHLAARNEWATKFTNISRELDFFGARFRTENTGILNNIHHMGLEAMLEKWLSYPPDVKKKQLDTQKLRQSGNTMDSRALSAVIIKLIADRALFDANKPSLPPPEMMMRFNEPTWTMERVPVPLSRAVESDALAFFYFDFKQARSKRGNCTPANGPSAVCPIPISLQGSP
ncbi:hypothetical protein B0H13DRAFT_1890457 [Mycena leptocephala]|nr:hypothetical protein B0H13DRAFT_1890457 [Mycena leptocephala]